MAIATPKVALHLYLNDPNGLLSAVIPHCTVTASPSPTKLNKHKTPLPNIEQQEKKVEIKDDIKEEEYVPAYVPDSDTPTSYRSTTSNKTLLSKGAATPISFNSCPALGCTWSINLDRDSKPKLPSPRKPPPEALLEKLRRKFKVEPVGVVRIKKKDILPTSYNIHRLQLSDKGQRRMTERLSSEWLDQYNEVSYRQQIYLRKIDQLRRGLQHNDEKRIIETIDKMRGTGEKEKHRRKFPVYTLTRMEENSTSQGPSPFPNRPCLFHVDDKYATTSKPRASPVDSPRKLQGSPTNSPRKLAPIIKKFKTSKANRVEDTSPMLTPRPGMVKTKTEYEPFESIAKRNKLNLTHFFNSSMSHRRGNKKLPMNVSTVTINETKEISDHGHSPFQFVTDFSKKYATHGNDRMESPD